MGGLTKERALLKRIVSAVNSANRKNSAKIGSVFKILAQFFLEQNKVDTSISCLELVKSVTKAQKDEIEEKTTKEIKKVEKDVFSREDIPMVTVTKAHLSKSGTPICDSFYLNKEFCGMYMLKQRKYKRVKLDFKELENSYEIGMVFAKEGLDGAGKRDYVYRLSWAGKYCMIRPANFVQDHGLDKKIGCASKADETDNKKVNKERFVTKQQEEDTFYFMIPKSC